MLALIGIAIIVSITVIGLARQAYLNVTFNRRVSRRLREIRNSR